MIAAPPAGREAQQVYPAQPDMLTVNSQKTISPYLLFLTLFLTYERKRSAILWNMVNLTFHYHTLASLEFFTLLNLWVKNWSE